MQRINRGICVMCGEDRELDKANWCIDCRKSSWPREEYFHLTTIQTPNLAERLRNAFEWTKFKEPHANWPSYIKDRKVVIEVIAALESEKADGMKDAQVLSLVKSINNGLKNGEIGLTMSYAIDLLNLLEPPEIVDAKEPQHGAAGH